MRINTNVSAINAWRNLTGTDLSLSKSLERLSSGFRINRAADDAAGLAVSEKMRAQIRGMNQAMKNAQDGISLVQTAEGAMNEVHTILGRMRELAVQASNDTLTNTDRGKIQSEMDQLAQEVTRITNTTQFNTKDLINGALESGVQGPLTFQIGPNTGQTMDVSVGAIDAFTLGISRNSAVETADPDDLVASIDAVGSGVSTAGYQIYFDQALGTVELRDSGGTTIGASVAASVNGQVTIGDSGTGETMTITLGATLPAANSTATVDATASQAAQFSGSIKTADAVAAGGLLVTTTASASSAITAIDAAINTVSEQRSGLGAIQNRLEHTINNLSVVSENLAASESRIRDVDMALELSYFARHQILLQAGSAMLAQANSKTQSVLQLLR